MTTSNSADLAALDRVAHRLALLDTADKLSNVLDKLLPRLLKRIGDNKDAQIHDKLVEMISHVLKRVRGDSAVKLPVVDLLHLLVQDAPSNSKDENTPATQDQGVTFRLPLAKTDVHPLTFNLSLTFVGVGLPRLVSHWSILPLLLTLLESTRANLENQQNRSVAHLLLSCLNSVYNSTTKRPDDDRFLETAQAMSGQATFEFILDILLYQPSRSSTLPPPGISAAGHERMLSAPQWRQQWINYKTVALQFIIPHRQFRLLQLRQHNVVTALVVATASAQHDIADAARIALKQHLDSCELESPKHILTSLLSLCQPAPIPEDPTWRRRPLLSAAVLQFCSSKLLDSYPSIRLEEEDLALDIAVRQLKEEDSRIKEASASLLRSVASRTTSTASLTRCLEVATSIISANGGLEPVRDSCYGIIATVARSAISVDFEVVSAVFGSLAREEDRLRPRALAALDSLLASFVQRLHPKLLQSNPWVKSSTVLDHAQLGKSLLPTLWTAAQSFQPKSSRVAAAQWASELLTKLDPLGACHLLCYLSGDSDSTTIAQTGLSTESKPEFGQMADILFATTKAPGRLKRYWEFSAEGKVHALQFALDCLLDDQLYGETPESIGLFLNAICETLSTKQLTLELLEMCASSLLATLATSDSARANFVVGKFNHDEVVSVALKVNSSAARRDLAAVYGELIMDGFIWESSNRTQWIEQSHVRSNVDRCLHLLPSKLDDPNFTETTNIVGVIAVASHMVKAVRLKAASGMVFADSDWEKAVLLVRRIGFHLTSIDEACVKSSGDALRIAFSYDDVDCPVLDQRMFSCIAATLHHLTVGIKKFGHGDSASATVVQYLARAAGVCLAASTTASNETSFDLGSKRIECVDALTCLLGSSAFRSDEELGIVVGEALSDFADAFSPPGAVWSKSGDWIEEFDLSFAHELPPHEHVLYVLTKKIAVSSSPHTKTAAGPALLALVSRAARMVSRWCERNGTLSRLIADIADDKEFDLVNYRPHDCYSRLFYQPPCRC